MMESAAYVLLWLIDSHCRPNYHIGVLGTSMLYNVGNSILAFTPQVNSRKLTKIENTSNYMYIYKQK